MAVSEKVAELELSYAISEAKRKNLEAENAKLKEALQEISDTEDLRFAFGFGYDLNIDTLAKQALKGESDGK